MNHVLLDSGYTITLTRIKCLLLESPTSKVASHLLSVFQARLHNLSVPTQALNVTLVF